MFAMRPELDRIRTRAAGVSANDAHQSIAHVGR
jgi:hypothetical protein